MPKLVIKVSEICVYYWGTTPTIPMLELNFMKVLLKVDFEGIAILMEETGIDDVDIDIGDEFDPLNMYLFCKENTVRLGLEYTLDEIKNTIDNHRTNYHNQKLMNTALLTNLLSCA